MTREQLRTAVVIDVLRMTSTAAMLMRHPTRPTVAVAATLQDLDRLEQPLSRYVVVSELTSESYRGARVDNSPAQVSRTEFGERTPVLVTTNGTRTLLAAAAWADRVLLASFLDLHALARHISGLSSVVLVPAGHFASGDERLEDELCADALASILAGREPDLAAYEATIRAHPSIRRRLAAERGFAEDLDLALQGDPFAAVLEFHPRAEGVGHILRA